jgi:hypothetical protein
MRSGVGDDEAPLDSQAVEKRIAELMGKIGTGPGVVTADPSGLARLVHRNKVRVVQVFALA